ncbi:MAG: RseA family anti-sigma factor [Arenimonas sp.]
MTNPADNLSEQLSAFMDGELPETEIRFLQRRLEHDLELRAKWARMQTAASCIKGQDWRPVREGLCAQVGAATKEPQQFARPGRNQAGRWAMAASVAALAILFAPRLTQNTPPHAATSGGSTVVSVAQHVLASPASADLVASPAASDFAGAVASGFEPPEAANSTFGRDNPRANARSNPSPLGPQSPTEFPLADTGEKRSWPRSELIGAASGPGIEAYLVRHNQMLANQGLSGFVPYVDVVASDQSATPEQDVSDADAGANRQ